MKLLNEKEMKGVNGGVVAGPDGGGCIPSPFPKKPIEPQPQPFPLDSWF